MTQVYHRLSVTLLYETQTTPGTLKAPLYAHQVPWVGFPLYKLLDVVKPLPSATYVEFQTFKNTAVSREQTTQPYYPWPYLEVCDQSKASSTSSWRRRLLESQVIQWYQSHR